MMVDAALRRFCLARSSPSHQFARFSALGGPHPALSKNDAYKNLDNYLEHMNQHVVWSDALEAYVAKYISKTKSVSGGKRNADDAFSSKPVHVNESDVDSADDEEEE